MIFALIMNYYFDINLLTPHHFGKTAMFTL